MIFFLPWVDMYYAYEGGIENAISIVINSYIISYVMWNAARFGMFVFGGFLSHKIFFTAPMINFGKRFCNLYQSSNVTIVKNLEKGNEMYLFHFREFANVDRKAIRRFFTTFLLVLFYFTEANIATILVGKYDLPTLVFLLSYVCLFQLIAVIGTLNIIQMSESLVCFAPQVGSALSILSGRKARIPISKCFKFLIFYEIVHNNKPFRFKFGSLGKLSKKTFVSFLFVYIAELLTLTSKFIRK